MKNKNKNSLVALIQATLVPLLSGVSLLVGRDRRGLGPGAWMDHLGPPSHSLVLHVVGLSTLSRHGLVSTEVLVVVRRGLPLLAELVTKPDSNSFPTIFMMTRNTGTHRCSWRTCQSRWTYG